jgi:hypothetical protein
VPNLDLNFAQNKSLIDDYSGTTLVTFTRASTGTYVGSDGLIKSATTNEPRFDHNPTTGESLGLLVEEARTNLLLRSEEFQTTWSTFDASITSDITTAPNGTTTADKLIENTVNTTHTTSQSVTIASPYTLSCSFYAKAGERNRVGIWLRGASSANRTQVTFNLSTGLTSDLLNTGLFSTLPQDNISSVVLYFNVTAVDGAGSNTANLRIVTSADFVEGTLTYNTRPTVSASVFASLASIFSTGIQTIDITTQAKRWINGDDPNYGFSMTFDATADTMTISGDSGVSRPYFLITLASGKVYKASATIANATNRWLGMCFATTSAGSAAPIQISNNYTTTGLTTDSPYYQSDTRGAIATSAGTVSKKVGLSLSTTEILLLNT